MRSKPGTGDMAEAERLAGAGVAASQHRGKGVGVDLAIQPEVTGGIAEQVWPSVSPRPE
jgi:hypothetical protein